MRIQGLVHVHRRGRRAVALTTAGLLAAVAAVSGSAGSASADEITSLGFLYHNVRGADGSWSGFAALDGYGGGGNAQVRDIAIAAMPDGSTQMVVIGADGGVYHRIRSANGGWSGFAPLNGLGSGAAAGAKAVAIAGLPDGSSQVVIASSGPDSGVYHRVRHPDGSWTEFSGLNGIGSSLPAGARDVAIAGLPDGSSQVLIASSAPDSGVYHRIRSANGSWSEFTFVNGIGTSLPAGATDVAIAGLPDGSTQSVIVSSAADHGVYHRFRGSDGYWSEFEPVNGIGSPLAAGANDVAIAGMPDGTAQVAIISSGDRGVYLRTRNPWGVWTEFAGVAGNQTPDTARGTDVAIAGFPNNSSQLAIGGDVAGTPTSPEPVIGWQGQTWKVLEGVISPETSQAFNHRDNVLLSNGRLTVRTQRHCYPGGLGGYTNAFIAARDQGQVLPLPAPRTSPCATAGQTFYSSGRIELAAPMTVSGDFAARFTGSISGGAAGPAAGTRFAYWLKNTAPAGADENLYNFCGSAADASPRSGELDLLEWYSFAPGKGNATTHYTCGVGGNPYLSLPSQSPLQLGTAKTYLLQRSGRKVTYTSGDGASPVVVTHACGPNGTSPFTSVGGGTCDLILNARWRVIIQGEVFKAPAGATRMSGPDSTKSFPDQTFTLTATTLTP